MARSMKTITDEVAAIKDERQALFRDNLGTGDDIHAGEPHEVRLRVLKAQNADAVLELDAKLEALRAEQRAHPDFDQEGE